MKQIDNYDEEKGLEEIEDSELLNSLLEMELATGDTYELVNHDDLFNKLDLDRAMSTFEKHGEFDKKRAIKEQGSKKSGLINEDYLRKLIAAEVRDEVEMIAEDIVERLTYQLQRIITDTFLNLKEENG